MDQRPDQGFDRHVSRIDSCCSRPNQSRGADSTDRMGRFVSRTTPDAGSQMECYQVARGRERSGIAAQMAIVDLSQPNFFRFGASLICKFVSRGPR